MLLDSKKCILLALIPFSLALDCTLSNAMPWPESSSGSGSNSDAGSGSGSSTTCGRLCGNNEGCLALCDRRKLKTRATLSCTENETCMVYTDNSLFCIDLLTTAFHDDTGGKGNLADGVYTDASGQATTANVEGTASPAATTTESPANTVSSTLTTSSSSPDSSSSASSDRTSVLVQNTSASRTSTSAGGVPAATTSASGVDRLGGRGSVYGVLGLVVGALVH